ncbi:MAG: YgfZ/GcvT domain-containing protein [Pseudomonadales bacterium]
MNEQTPVTAEPLSELAVSLFQGSDVRKFLQGYLTCDTDLLLPGETALPAALCNLKGRVVANGWAAGYEDDHRIIVITHASVAGTLREFLKKYLVFSKTTASAWQPKAGLWGDVDNPNDRTGMILDSRRRLYFQPPSGQASSTERFFASLVRDQRVLIQASTSEQFLPQMLGLDQWGAVDFHKGCYLGQEVVARAQHRGQVKRQLVSLVQTNTAATVQPPAPGTALLDPQENPAGIVVQSVALQTPSAYPSANVLAVVPQRTASDARLLHIAGEPGSRLSWPT